MIAPWAEEEVSEADFGDTRLDDRLCDTVVRHGKSAEPEHPPRHVSAKPRSKAAYRFFDNDKVTFAKVIEPHIAKSKQRVAEQPVVLFVQDATEIDLTRPEQDVTGVGELDGARRGFLLHEVQAFTPDGIPSGTVWAEPINRTEGVSHAPPAEKKRQRKRTPIEDEESMRWVTGLREARQVAREVPAVQCVCVADSEADISTNSLPNHGASNP